MLYRIHRKLDVGGTIIPARSIVLVNTDSGDDAPLVPGIYLKPKSITKLVQKGAISPLSAPPLAAMPGWSKRADRLVKHNIATFSDFFECSNSNLARIFKVKIETIINWKRELLQTVTMPVKRSGG